MVQCKEGDTVQRAGWGGQTRGAVALAWSRASVTISITKGGDKLVAHGSQSMRTMIMISTSKSSASTFIF